ncbi:hypothetical protein IHE44_0008504 [Lamprotornis superbus]|uniref:Uncharacterized protein n=1 Tax=Lamprotornis superbus TaxID=245042 RepID=A0A835NM39_9PASS|nr:hypothetical protein IHE44_0008504 [Lamprotornis superbus]
MNHSRPSSSSSSFPVGSRVTFTCSEGARRIPGLPDTMECLPGKIWSRLPEPCGRSCAAPARLSFAALSKVDGRRNFFPVGTNVSYVCRPGYENTSESSPSSTCLENLTWSQPAELCRKMSCGAPGALPGGRMGPLMDLQLGARVDVSCEDGYKLVGNNFIWCQLKGKDVEWSKLPTCESRQAAVYLLCCEREKCVSRENTLGRNEREVGQAEPHPPSAGHPSASKVHLPEPSNVANTVPFSPAVITCSPPPAISHGRHDGEGVEIFVYNSTVTYSCEPNFQLVGNGSIQCRSRDKTSGVWSGAAPECKEKSSALTLGAQDTDRRAPPTGPQGNGTQPSRKGLGGKMKLSFYKKDPQSFSKKAPQSFSKKDPQSTISLSQSSSFLRKPVSRHWAASRFRFVLPLYKSPKSYSGATKGSMCPPKEVVHSQEKLDMVEILVLQIPHPLQRRILSMKRRFPSNIPTPAVIPADPSGVPEAALSPKPQSCCRSCCRARLCHTQPDALFPGFLLTGNATTNPKHSPQEFLAAADPAVDPQTEDKAKCGLGISIL